MTIIENIRELIAQGDPGAALEQLVPYVSREKKDQGTLRLLRILESRLNAARQKERKGILDPHDAQQEYNAISDALLGIADDLEAGRKPVIDQAVFGAPAGMLDSRITWFIGGAILILLTVIAVVLIRQSHKTPVVQIQEGVENTADKKCPDFNENGFRIMLIPFQNLRNDAGVKPELGLQERIRMLTRNNNVASDVQILPGKRFDNFTPDQLMAKKLGLTCGADMVIWGQYEMIGDEINVDVQYVFTKEPNLAAGGVSDNFKSLSELKSNKMKFTSLEQAVFSLCAMMALHEGNTQLAQKWLDKISNPTPDFQKIKRILKEKR